MDNQEIANLSQNIADTLCDSIVDLELYDKIFYDIIFHKLHEYFNDENSNN